MDARRSLVGLAALGALMGGLLGWSGPIRGFDPDMASPTVKPQVSPVAVHVAGAVARPGVVWVRDGALTADAISQAGGALPGAALDQINLAAPVFAGDHIEVPGSSVEAGTAREGDASNRLIDINSADATELQSLPGVGPVLAERIVAYRETHGRFEEVEDLLGVSGIGEQILASVRDLIKPP